MKRWLGEVVGCTDVLFRERNERCVRDGYKINGVFRVKPEVLLNARKWKDALGGLMSPAPAYLPPSSLPPHCGHLSSSLRWS